MAENQLANGNDVDKDAAVTFRSAVDDVVSGQFDVVYSNSAALSDDRISAMSSSVRNCADDVTDDDDHDDPFLAGFRDCRCQILSYMQQMQHQQQQQSNTVSSATFDDVINTAMIDDELVGCLRQHLLEAEHRLRVVAFPTPWKHSSNSTSVLTGHSCIVFDDTQHGASDLTSSFDDSALGTSFEASTTATVDADMAVDSTVPVQVPSEVELSDNANELMRLACNNPDVGRLLDELFELMDYDDDNDVITSDVESDDGVHELNGEVDTYVDVAHSSAASDVCTT